MWKGRGFARENVAIPVCWNGSARENGIPFDFGDFIRSGHDLNLLGHSAPLHCDYVFVPGRLSGADNFRGK
jgi:hypothetical protein